jgi:hypothetical protein
LKMIFQSSLLRCTLFQSASLAATLLACMLASAANAQRTFKTADEAAMSLANAARSGERDSVLAVLGSGGADIVQSGDATADAATRQRFLAAFDEKHQIATVGGKKAIIVVGREEFPFPIPLVRDRGSWRFDTAAGRAEILYRRIGRNELDAIQACLAYVDAQNEYADMDRTGEGAGTYAQRIISQLGKKDGLYWPSTNDEAESPLGELVADASAEGYRVSGERAPFHGYYYKILTKQGSAAPGGALDYVVHGKMIGGFALVAYPATYRNSGVMTFLINHQGTIFQKDLGPQTAETAERMTAFNPDSSWKAVSISQPQ